MYGIDVGTSNTVVTIKSDECAKVLPIGQDGVVPSLMFFAKDQLPIIGHDAVLAYTQALQRKKRHTERFSSSILAAVHSISVLPAGKTE